MPFSSYSDLLAEISAGKTYRMPFQRVIQTGATSAQGRWHECFTAGGTGGTGILTGTAGVGAALSNATAGSIPEPNNATSPDTRHLTTFMAVTASATAVPALVTLTDFLYIYPSCVVSTGAGTVLNNGAARPTRHGNGEGVQVSAFVVGALGAASPTLTVSYTNSAGVAGRTGTLVAPAASIPVGTALVGGVAGATAGPYMLLQAGDSGVRQIDSYTTASGTTGTITFVMHRPISTVPLVAQNIAGERDLVNQFVSLPRLQDAACLVTMMQVGGALLVSNSFYGELQAAWG